MLKWQIENIIYPQSGQSEDSGDGGISYLVQPEMSECVVTVCRSYPLSRIYFRLYERSKQTSRQPSQSPESTSGETRFEHSLHIERGGKKNSTSPGLDDGQLQNLISADHRQT